MFLISFCCWVYYSAYNNKLPSFYKFYFKSMMYLYVCNFGCMLTFYLLFFFLLFSNAIYACDNYFKQGHRTKFSTKLMNKICGRLKIVFQRILPVIKLYITTASDLWSSWIHVIYWKTIVNLHDFYC